MLEGVSRGISVIGLSFRNVLYFLLFVSVILFLFFIPEILKFNWSHFFGMEFKRQAIQQVQVISSPLEDLIQRINAGQYSRVKPEVKTPAKDDKPQISPTFNPELKLTRLEITKIPDQGNLNQRPATIIEMSGVLKGNDVKRMALFQNGEFVQKIAIARTNDNNIRQFNIAKQNAYGRITLYVEDKHGRVYTKTYKFFPRAERFPNSRNVYKLKRTIDGLDPRVEKYFTIAESIPGSHSGNLISAF